MPLSTKQTDKIHTPNLFFLPRMTPYPDWVALTVYAVGDYRTVDDYEYKCLEDHTSSSLWGDDVLKWEKHGPIPYSETEDPFTDHPIFDIPHLEEVYASGKGMRRRAKPKAIAPDVPVDQTVNARLQKITGKQHFFVDGFYDGDPIYTWELIPEYGSPGDWTFQPLDGTVDIDNVNGILTCTGVQGGFEWDIQIGFSADNSKWSIDVTAPGFTVRVRQEIVFTALGQQMVADGDLKVGYEDFPGVVSDDAGLVTRNIIYEPDGVDATSGWVVDPYISVTSGATIVVTTGAEVITFTVSTENALLKEANSLRVVIYDDVCWWYIYDLRLLCYQHTAGTPGSGMALTTDHGTGFPYTVDAGDHDWYPLTAGEETNKAAREAQLEDVTMVAPSTGSEVADLVLPGQLADGFGYDRARHLEEDTAVIEYTADIARIGHVDVIHDSPFNYGGVDKLVGHWKMDDIDADTVLDDETGTAAAAASHDVNTLTTTDAVQGKAIQLDKASSEYITLPLGAVASWKNAFTISIITKGIMAFDAAEILYMLRFGGSDEIYLQVDSLERLGLYSTIGGVAANFALVSLSQARLSLFNTYSFGFDLTYNIVFLAINNVVQQVKTQTGVWGGNPTVHRIARTAFSSYGSWIIDNVKLINGCVLPYGAYYTGNGAVDATAHSDITFYASGADCTSSNVEIGGITGTKGGSGGAFPTTGGVYNDDYFDTEGTAELHFSITSTQMNLAHGSISFWFYVNAFANGDYLFGIGDGSQNNLLLEIDSAGHVDFTYEAGNTIEGITGSNIVLTASTWNHCLATFSDSANDGKIYLYLNGVEEGNDTVANSWAAGSSLTGYVGAAEGGSGIADVYISHLYITNNPYTPQISTMLGVGPRYMPRETIN